MLRHFLEYPRSKSWERWIQTRLIRIAAFITRMRGLQPRDHWWALYPSPIWQWLRLAIIAWAVQWQLIHHSLTVIASAEAMNDAAGTTLDTSTSLNLATGDVCVSAIKHEQAADATSSVAGSGGGNTFTKGTVVNHSNGDLTGWLAYLLSATANATETIRLNTASRTFRCIIVYQFRPDSGDTVSLDVQNTGQGTGTTRASGTVTTTGDDEAALGMLAHYGNETLSNRQINGVAADAFQDAATSDFSLWYRLLTATFAGGTAAVTSDTAFAWIVNIIALKSTAGGGGASIVPVLMKQYRKRWA